MDKKIKIIFVTYSPNNALTNRLLAMVRGLSELGVNIELTFVYPNRNFDTMMETYPNVSVRYLWKKHPTKSQLTKRILAFYDMYFFSKTIKSGDYVLLIGSGQFLPLLIKRKGVHIYHERTEHPSVVKVIPNFMQNSYLKSCSKLDGMFVISTTLKKYFETIGVSNVHIINMIVDDNRFSNLKKEENKVKYIAYCGKATNNKDGVDELIKAFSIISSKHSDTKLMIIGKAPKEKDESGIMELVENYKITDKVIFTNTLPTSEIPQLLKNAEVCVLDRPDSLQAQCGFPTKLGEYLLSGNPVVITKVGDIPLFLSHKENALLAEERNPEDFAKQVCWVLDNPEKAKIIGENGRLLALEVFNYKTESEKIANVIFPE